MKFGWRPPPALAHACLTFGIKAILMRLFGKSGYLRTATRAARRELSSWAQLTVNVLLARLNRRRLKARMVAVTGSSGKTTTSSLLASILQEDRRVALGAIGNSLFNISRTLRAMSGQEDVAVIETSTHVQGDIAAKAKLIRPDVAVVTLVALEHHASFRTVDAIAEEKADLVRALLPRGIAVLNADDPRVLAMRDLTPARIVTFGRSEGADYRVRRVEYSFPGPLMLNIEFAGGSCRIISQLNGSHFWLPVAAAFATAVELGAAPEAIVRRIAGFEPVFNRMSILRGEGKPTFLLDAAKAPYQSIQLAIDTIETASAASYRRIVIGFISDYSTSSRQIYRKVYKWASAVADEVIFVGPNAPRARVPKEDLDAGRAFLFEDVREVVNHIESTTRPGEVVLLKSSSGLHLERVGLAIHEQVECWDDKCGYSVDCKTCGMYRYPVGTHSSVRRRARRGRAKPKPGKQPNE